MIRFVFRWAFRLLVLALVVSIGLLLLKDTLAKNLAEKRIRQETGLDVKLGHVEVGILSPRVRIEGLVLYNSPEFGGSIFADIPEIHLEYHPGRLPLQKVHFRFLRLNIRELHIVENDRGRTNLVELLYQVSPEALGSKPAQSETVQLGGVDLLNLSLDKIRYTNMRRPGRNQESAVGMKDELIRDIRSEEDLAAILFKILLRAGITIYHDKPSA